MKVGILTFPNSTSFGAVLQMYALYKTVKEKKHSTDIINYYNKYMKEEHHTRAIQDLSFAKKKIRLGLKRVIHYRQKQKFTSFEKKMNLYPAKPLTYANELEALKDTYDYVICGSDQVWNPNITGNDTSYFLDFCGSNTKRISYAPSFGVTELESEFKTKIAQEIKKFWAVSVREKEGQMLLEQSIGETYPIVLDPTFLVTKEEWAALEKKHKSAKEPYILYYTVSHSEKLYRFCEKLAKKKNMRMVVVGGNLVHAIKNRNVEYALDIGPEEWLYLIHHAECVVTNSFHGTAFSINYQKNFYVEFSSATNSRLEQIIRITDLHDRVVKTDGAKSEGEIDYRLVEKRLNPLLESSRSFLENAISCR